MCEPPAGRCSPHMPLALDRSRVHLAAAARPGGHEALKLTSMGRLGTHMTAVAALKDAHRATWAAGDYASVAELIDEAPCATSSPALA